MEPYTEAYVVKFLDIDGLKGLNNLKSISIGGINFSGLDNKIFIT